MVFGENLIYDLKLALVIQLEFLLQSLELVEVNLVFGAKVVLADLLKQLLLFSCTILDFLL